MLRLKGLSLSVVIFILLLYARSQAVPLGVYIHDWNPMLKEGKYRELIQDLKKRQVQMVFVDAYWPTGQGDGEFKFRKKGPWNGFTKEPAYLDSYDLDSLLYEANSACIEIHVIVDCFGPTPVLPTGQLHQEHLREVVQYLLNNFPALHGIHLDYVRYVGHDAQGDTNTIADFISTIENFIGSKKLSSAVFPAADEVEYLDVWYAQGQSYEKMSRYLDFICPMAYHYHFPWPGPEWVGQVTSFVKSRVSNTCLVVPDIQTYYDDNLQLPGYQETYNAVSKALQRGADGINIFVYGHTSENEWLAVLEALGVTALLFEDDFESDSVGSYPSPPWYNLTSGVSAYVSTEQACSGTKSFRLEGYPMWARGDVVSLSPPDKLSYEVCVYLTSAGKRASVGFLERFGNMLPRFNGIYFDDNGTLWFTGYPWSQLSGSWSPSTWYKVGVDIDFVSLKANVYVNDELKGENLDILPKEFDDPSYGHVILNQFGLHTENFSGGGTNVVYFDDVKILEISDGAIADCDNDGLSDELELATGTDPFDDDTDDDGLLDGPGSGEDVNANGVVDPGETDPRNPDTDGDGILDGTELGLIAPEGSGTDMNVFVSDADPSTVTDPTNPDTDGDGISDGEEDTNKNGRVDPGELNPNVFDIAGEIDIDPNTLNLESEGRWITCYIELPPEYNPKDINISTVKLNDTIYAESKPVQIDDYDSDTIADLMVKFDRSAVKAILVPGDSVPVSVRGWVKTEMFWGHDTTQGWIIGKMFFGYDTIRVIGEGSPKIVADGSENIPDEFVLCQNYPNPFNPETDIAFALPEDAKVSIVIFNVLGQRVRTLINAHKMAGRHVVHWDGRNDSGKLVSSGIYFYRLKTEKFTEARKMLLIK